MPKNTETTTKFKVDISELKSQFAEAQRQIRLANSEFKAATAGMDNWGKSADGLSAKINQLNNVLTAEKTKLASLEKQYALVSKEQGENSKGAQELLIKINNQRAAIGRTEASLSKYDKQLDEVKQGMSGVDDEAENVNSAFKDVEKSADKAGDGFTIMKGAIASLIADGLKALAKTAAETMKDLVTETEKAYGSFQAQTGASAAEMKKFKKQIDSIYKAGLGESLQDVADAMAEVKQQTKETDPSKLKELTENAIALRDTFGMDVKESMRAVNMLMEQFGISGEEAYNLIVQGAQQGLDKNGDLLDTINEYGVHYKQLGYDADDFFNSLSNGTKAGTFSVDKLGDAMKEFGIRTKDTANSTTEGFELTGLNADKMRKAFAKGGDSAKKATEKTLDALLKMDDKVKQNQAGVDLFGTMWEDLGIEGVKALMNTNGKLDKTKKSMEEMKQVKYDNVATEFTKIGRTLQMDFLTPLAEKAIPHIKEFADYIINNMDQVVAAIKLVGGAIATVFVVNKIATFTQSIMTMISAFGALKTATEGATVAQRILNLVQKANPIGLLVTAVGALTVGLVAYAASVEDTETKEDKLIKKHDETRNSISELEKSYKQVADARDKSVANAQSQFGYYQSLKDELDGLVDKNGKVKKSEQDRAQFIMTTLNEALGSELKLTKDGTTNYLEQKKALDKLIKTKKAQIILDANEAVYTEAINNKTKAFQNLKQAQADSQETAKALTKAHKDLATAQDEKALEEYIRMYGNTEGINQYREGIKRAKEAVSKLEGEQKKNQKSVTDAENKWKDYNAVIENYEGLSSAIIGGDTKKINNALDNMVNKFVSAKVGTKKQLEDQVKNMKKNYSDLQKAVKDGTPGVTQEMVDTAKKMVDKSEKELAKLTPKAKTQGKKAGKAAADGVKSKTKDAESAGKEVSKSAKKGMESENTKSSGAKKAGDFNKGVESKKSDAKTKGKAVSKKAKEGLEETKTKSSGTNFVQGFIDGVNGKSNDGSLFSSVSSMAGKAIKWLNEKLDEHSPSGKTKKSGQYFTEGFAIGISSEIEKVGTAVTKLANQSLTTLLAANKTGKYESAGEKAAKAFESGITKKTNQVEKAVESMVNKAVKKATAKTKDSKTKKAFESLGKSMITNFSSVFEKAADKMATKVQTKLDKITSTFQTKYDAIKDLQSDLETRLKNIGDLYTEDEDGQITLLDLSQQTDKINQFGSNLEKLKGKLSKDLMAQIAAMDTEEGLKFTNQLLSISDADLKAYNAAYTQKLKASTNVAKTYYADQVLTLKSQYSEKVKKEMKSLKKELSKLGENAIEGFLKGFSSKDKETTKAVKSFTSSLVKKLKKELGIHSPSKVMRDMVGRFIPAGVAEGIKANADTAVKAMQTMADDIITPMRSSLSNAVVDSGSHGAMVNRASNVTNVYNFSQTNNSPKALSRWDIYRQSNNLLRGVQNV